VETLDLLQRLSDAFGVSGFEDEARDALRAIVTPLVDDVRVDTLGNLIATRHGDGPTLMLDAHIDEIGFMVSHIEPGGYLRFVNLGGWDVRIIPSHIMTVVTDDGERVSGVIGTPPPHILEPKDRERPAAMDELFVDIGVSSDAEARALGVRVGSPAYISYGFRSLNERVVAGKALDDRAGCAAIIKALEALAGQQLDVNLVAVFSVAEEIGLLGATTATFQTQPAIALALEGTICADAPGVPPARNVTRSGSGPAITVADGSQVVPGRMVRALTGIAEAAGLPWQYKTPRFGGTNAGAIQRVGPGVLAGVVSVPCRYIHSPFAVMNLNDFEQTAQLVTAFVKEARGRLLA
jgi:tetrahedral aminopeptidase